MLLLDYHPKYIHNVNKENTKINLHSIRSYKKLIFGHSYKKKEFLQNCIAKYVQDYLVSSTEEFRMK